MGYLLDAVGQVKLAAPLAKWLVGQHPRVVPLQPGGAAHAEADGRWRVAPNVELEVEV